MPINSRSEHDSYKDAQDGGLPSRGLLIRDQYSGFNHYTPDEFIDGLNATTNPAFGGEPLAGLTCQDAGDYFAPTPQERDNYVPFAVGSWCAIDMSSNGSLTNERKRTAAYLSGTYELTDSLEAYAKYIYLETDTTGTLDNLFTPFVWVAGPQRYGAERSVWARNVSTNPATGGFQFDPGYSAFMDFRIQKIFPGVYRGTSYVEDTSTIDFGLRGVLNNGFEWDVSYLSLIHI